MAVGRRIDGLAVGLMAVPVVVSVPVWDQLPTQMPIHLSAGSPDTHVSKTLATVGLFAFGVATVVATRLAPESLTNTPGGEDVTIAFVSVVFAYSQLIVLVWNLGYRFNVSHAVLPVLLVATLLAIYSVR